MNQIIMSKKINQVWSFIFIFLVYHVNDTVLLVSGNNTPYVCRIERMMQKGPRQVMYCRWFFRPHDVANCYRY
jgi:hypothetical protein